MTKTIKVTTTVYRKCCEVGLDLVRIKMLAGEKMYRCIHCGEIWIAVGYTDAAGGSDTELVRYNPKHALGACIPIPGPRGTPSR
jgi:hypothetical protein